MIGLIMNEKLSNNSIDSLNLAVNKLRLLTSDIIIPTSIDDFQYITQIFERQENIKVIMRLDSFTKYGNLADIYCASSQFNNVTDFLTVSPSICNVNQEVLSTIADNQNSFATTVSQNCLTISHFAIDNQDLSAYLKLNNFDLEDFLIQEVQCMPVSFARSDIF